MRCVRSIAFAAVAAGTLAGCSSTGSSEPDGFGQLRDELANGLDSAMVHADGTTVGSGTATVQMDAEGSMLTVEADGNSFVLTSNAAPNAKAERATQAAWENPVDYAAYSFANADYTGAVTLGEYFALVYLSGFNGGVADRYVTQGGLETPEDGLPAQLVAYEGTWAILGTASNGTSLGGVYEADADFDAGTIQFAINEDDGATALGNGSGTISGNSFTSSFEVTGGTATSSNTVEGGFYGPGGEEMAGLIAGTNGTEETFGYLFGHQK